MKVVNKFSFKYNNGINRYVVKQDDNGFYHLDKWYIADPGKVNAKTNEQVVTSVGEDIHGPMTAEAYINWLTGYMFNECFVAASKIEKTWMLSKEKEVT